MGQMSQRHAETALDRADEAERDRRFLSSEMVRTATDLGTVASELGRLADAGRSVSPREVRAIVAGLRYLADDLMESSRVEGR